MSEYQCARYLDDAQELFEPHIHQHQSAEITFPVFLDLNLALPFHPAIMSASIGRAASKVAQAATKSGAKVPEGVAGKDGALKTGAKRDPELFVGIAPRGIGFKFQIDRYNRSCQQSWLPRWASPVIIFVIQA